MARVFFFLGKGGVGKSTISSLAAMTLAAENADTLLLSLDPAHNLSDIFQKKFSSKPKKVSSRLLVMEIDERAQMRKYLKAMENRLKQAYRYHSAFNLGGYFSIVRHSPGIEEYALLRSFMEAYRRYNRIDAIVVDLPPTALALKFLRLPSLSILWLEKLLELRRTILEKKEIISRIKIGPRTMERDRVLRGIEESLDHYRHSRDVLVGTDTASYYIVTNNDALSMSETMKINSEARGMGLPLKGAIINRLPLCDNEPKHRRGSWPEISYRFPTAEEALTGMAALNRFRLLQRHNPFFADLLKTVRPRRDLNHSSRPEPRV
ncbi:MAG TPA: ArsA family ATPase [Spirochaetes bacterium]|nr:ArsA family ATPase [Spirochaetota bacterium]